MTGNNKIEQPNRKSMNDLTFDKLTALEELLRKNRGLTYLLSRTVGGMPESDGPDELAVQGIHDLSDSLAHDLGKVYCEVFEACKSDHFQPTNGGVEGA
jgi:hypothetical protein